jgi:hypothetical protein
MKSIWESENQMSCLVAKWNSLNCHLIRAVCPIADLHPNDLRFLAWSGMVVCACLMELNFG